MDTVQLGPGNYYWFRTVVALVLYEAVGSTSRLTTASCRSRKWKKLRPGSKVHCLIERRFAGNLGVRDRK